MPPFPELKDITPPTAPPLSSPEEIQLYVVLPIFCTLLAVLALFCLWAWWRWRGRRAKMPPLPVAADEAAARALEDVRGRAGTLAPAELGREVAGIVRGYLQRAHGLRAGQQTTEELLGRTRPVPGAPPLPFVKPFDAVLARCDALKFSGPVLAAGESDRLLDATRAALDEERRWRLTPLPVAAPIAPDVNAAEPPAPAAPPPLSETVAESARRSD